MPAALEVIRDPQKAEALLPPVRARLLARLAQPGSAAGLARVLGLPRQQVNYHLKELERHGFVEFVEERRKGNCNERLVRATATAYVMSPEVLGSLGPDPAARRDRFSAAYLISAAARIIRELAVLGLRASRAGKRISTLTLEAEVRFRSPEDRTAFAEELANTLARLAAKYHDDNAAGGRPFRFVLAGYPQITRQEEEDGAQSARLENDEREQDPQA